MNDSRVFFAGFLLSLCLLVIQDRSLSMDCSTDDGSAVKCQGISGQPKTKRSNNVNRAIMKRTIRNFYD